MRIDLTDTTASDIAAALVQARRSSGSPAMGMVLTLIVIADEDCQADALMAAREAAKEHPSRIIGVIPHRERTEPRLDAQVRVGSDIGPGEDLLLRMYGQLTRHPASVVTPLLLPESPVVAWWPAQAPKNPSLDPIGQLAQRRVTDASAAHRPLQTLLDRAENYARGDTDLAWSRTTPWRALLAAALDQPTAKITGASVEAVRSNPSADLLCAWLADRLGVDATLKATKGPGITAARLHTAKGEIAITRPDGRLAAYSMPDQPNRHVALARRETFELLAEELRWLDPDELYEQTVSALLRRRANSGSNARGNGRRKTTGTNDTRTNGRTPARRGNPR